jgi:hypothetical protein
MTFVLFLTLKPNPNPNHKNPLLFANDTTNMSETVFFCKMSVKMFFFWGAKFHTVAKLLNCLICLKCNDFLKIAKMWKKNLKNPKCCKIFKHGSKYVSKNV